MRLKCESLLIQEVCLIYSFVISIMQCVEIGVSAAVCLIM